MACFFFNDTATTEISTLSLHDALPIWARASVGERLDRGAHLDQPLVQVLVAAGDDVDVAQHRGPLGREHREQDADRSEEHTSELQSRQYLVCRLLLEKKKSRPRSCRLR